MLGAHTGTLWDDAISLTPGGLVTHVLLIHELFRGTAQQINNVFWSVAVEWKIYFAFPLLVIAHRRWGGLITTVLAVVLSYLLLIALRATAINTHTCGISAHYVGLFTMGLLGAEVAFSPAARYARLRRRVPWTAVLIVMTAVTLAASQVRLAHENLTPFNDFIVGVWSMVLLITLATRERTVFRAARVRRDLRLQHLSDPPAAASVLLAVPGASANSILRSRAGGALPRRGAGGHRAVLSLFPRLRATVPELALATT